MADSTLDSELFILIDNWPGQAIRHLDNVPTGGIVGSTHHNVATAAYSPGDKIQVRNHTLGKEGFATFIYLQYDGTGAEAMAAKQFVVQSSATTPYVVTNDPDLAGIVATGNSLAAVALSAMTDQRYGWFWCGGVCPELFVPTLGGNFATEGNVVAGAIVVHDLAADAMGIGPLAGTEQAIGFALAADAA
jgi:hypothetical protein